MEMEIAEKNDNPLLHRQEVQIVIRHENMGTPKRKEVIQNLSEQLKAKKDLIVIDHLKNKYGKTKEDALTQLEKTKSKLALLALEIEKVAVVPVAS